MTTSPASDTHHARPILSWIWIIALPPVEAVTIYRVPAAFVVLSAPRLVFAYLHSQLRPQSLVVSFHRCPCFLVRYASYIFLVLILADTAVPNRRNGC
ncbi:hypothetical protein BDQ17DRAFT_745198 [Cyathus striatus]|nr:hypothetical protein BDQ17DRAFT_745198 [Cyathus striatus]